MDIIVHGQRRFALLHLDEEKAYLRCESEFFDDEAGEVPSDDARRREAMRLYALIVESGGLTAEERVSVQDPPNTNDPQLSFQIVARLPADLGFRQSLLVLRSESDRLNKTVAYLMRLSRRLDAAAQARARAGRNGRGR
jgi:Lon protease-like protein